MNADRAVTILRTLLARMRDHYERYAMTSGVRPELAAEIEALDYLINMAMLGPGIADISKGPS